MFLVRRVEIFKFATCRLREPDQHDKNQQRWSDCDDRHCLAESAYLICQPTNSKQTKAASCHRHNLKPTVSGSTLARREQFGPIDRKRRYRDCADNCSSDRCKPQRPAPREIRHDGEQHASGNADCTNDASSVTVGQLSTNNDADSTWCVGGKNEDGDENAGESAFGSEELVEELGGGCEEERPKKRACCQQGESSPMNPILESASACRGHSALARFESLRFRESTSHLEAWIDGNQRNEIGNAPSA